MKRSLTYCMLIVAVFAGSQSGSAARGAEKSSAHAALADVRLKLPKAARTMGSLFAAVEKQTRFTFVYMKDSVPLDDAVELNGEDYSLSSLLAELSRRFRLAFTQINERIVVKQSSPASAGTVILAVSVRDYSTNEPLAFANIAVDSTQQGSAADADGRAELELAPGRYTIRCAFVGYKTERIPVTLDGDADLSVVLRESDVVLQDVTVFAHRVGDGEQTEVNALTLQSDAIKRVTSLIPDVMRSVQMLPGVSTNNEFSSRFNVRGGNQDENLVLVNGTQVYDPFHVKEASNASIGIFNAEMIRKMDLMTGGFTARYGDKMSSVLDIEYREGSREHFSGSASLSLLDVNALVEGPMGEHGSFIIGGRKSYFEYVMKMIDADRNIHPSFYDVQGVFAYAPSPAGKLMLKLIYSGDDFFEDPHRNTGPLQQWTGNDNTGAHFVVRQRSNDTSESHATYYSTMAALQYSHILSSEALIRSEVSVYDQRENENAWREYLYAYRAENPQTTYFYNSDRVDEYRNSLLIRTYEANTALDLQLLPAYGVKAGVSYQWIEYFQNLLDRQTIDEFTNEYHMPDTTLSHRIENASDAVSGGVNTRSYKAAGYLENIMQVSDRLLVNAGLRADYFDLNRGLTWSPRLNLSYNAGRGLTVRAAWGHYYQSPVYRQLAYSTASDTNTQAQHAVHVIAGINYDLELDHSSMKFLRFRIEGYRKTYDHLITASVTSQGVVNYSRKNDAEGRSSGLDVQVIYSAPAFYGWISYGYLFARQTSMVDGHLATFPRYTDQRHTLAVTGECDLGKDWRVNSRFVYGSGYPYRPSYAVMNTVKRVIEWIPDPLPNSQYLPSYARVDMKIAKDFDLFGWTASAFLDVSNLFNTTNIQAYRYQFTSQGQPYREDVKLWPILPTVGFAVKF
jgi:hypothetical protein